MFSYSALTAQDAGLPVMARPLGNASRRLPGHQNIQLIHDSPL